MSRAVAACPKSRDLLRACIAAIRLPPALWLVLLTLTGGLVLFSQTLAWYGDEGVHLLASQLIVSGKKPYLDFIFPQTPIWAYVDAGWMRIFGDTWRSAHILAALLTSGSMILSAGISFIGDQQVTGQPFWTMRASCLG